jgi:hypothetical protein
MTGKLNRKSPAEQCLWQSIRKLSEWSCVVQLIDLAWLLAGPEKAVTQMGQESWE